MTKQEAQVVLLRAFVATGELPDDVSALVLSLITATQAFEKLKAPKCTSAHSP